MANNKIQIKRTFVSGRTPNTTNFTNSQYINTGELALNLVDQKMYTSNGSVYFEIGANLENQTVSNTLTVSAVSANGSLGTPGYVLTSNGSSTYWSIVSGTGTVTQVDTGSGLTGGPITTSGTLSVLANSGIVANTSGLFVKTTDGLAVNSSGVYVNTASQFTWSNSHTFNALVTANNVSVTGNISSVDSIYFANAGIAATEGILTWNPDEGTLDLGLAGNNVINQLGQELLYRVKNQTASTILNGTVVMANGTLGLSGKIKVAPAIANGAFPSQYIMGVATENIASGGDGYVTHFGKVRGLNTSGWSNGTILYADPANNGGLTATKPQAPNGKTIVALVISSHATNGELFVRPTYGSSLSDDEFVEFSGLANGDVIIYHANDGRFENFPQTTLNVNSALVSNSATYLGGNTASDILTYTDNKSGNAYSNAVSYADNKAGNAYSNAVTYADNKAGNAYSNAIAYAASNTTLYTYFAQLSGATFTGNVAANNITTNNDLHVGHDLYVQGNLTIGSNVTVIGANNVITIDNMIYLNANATSANPDLGIVGGYNDGVYHHAGIFRDASDGVFKVFDNYVPEPDDDIYIDTANNTFHLADFQANTIYIGNTSVYSTINTTSFTGTANNSTYAFGKSESALNVNSALTSNASSYLGGNTVSDIRTYADQKAGNAYSNSVTYVTDQYFVNTSQLSTNLANYQTTAGLASNVATLTSNNATYAFGKTESALNVNSAFMANDTYYAFGKTESALNVNSALTSNNSTYAFGKTESALNVNSALTSNNSSYAFGKTESALNVNSALTSNSSSYLGGNTVSDIRTYADQMAGNAYSNSIAYAASNTALYTYFAQLSGATFTGNVAANNIVTNNYIYFDNDSINTIRVYKNNFSFGACTAFNNVTTGTENIGIGGLSSWAGGAPFTSITTGDGNIAIGPGALNDLQTGNFNIAVGVDAVANGVGNSNIGIGRLALDTINGDNNIGIGYEAGLNLTNVHNTVVIGSYHGSGMTNGCIVISSGTGAARLFIDNNGYAGFGNTVPSTALSVDGETYTKGYTEPVSNVAISSGSVTLNMAAANFFEVTLNSNITSMTISNVPTSRAQIFVLKLNITGTYTVAWPASFKWPGGTPPTLSTTNGDVQTIVGYTVDGGTTIQAFNAGYTR